MTDEIVQATSDQHGDRKPGGFVVREFEIPKEQLVKVGEKVIAETTRFEVVANLASGVDVVRPVTASLTETTYEVRPSIKPVGSDTTTVVVVNKS